VRTTTYSHQLDACDAPDTAIGVLLNAEIEELYRAHNPEKLADVPTLLAKCAAKLIHPVDSFDGVLVLMVHRDVGSATTGCWPWSDGSMAPRLPSLRSSATRRRLFPRPPARWGHRRRHAWCTANFQPQQQQQEEGEQGKQGEQEEEEGPCLWRMNVVHTLFRKLGR
jgi:hypothetical protein